MVQPQQSAPCLIQTDHHLRELQVPKYMICDLSTLGNAIALPGPAAITMLTMGMDFAHLRTAKRHMGRDSAPRHEFLLRKDALPLTLETVGTPLDMQSWSVIF